MDERRVRFQGKQTRFLLGLGMALVLLAGIIFVSTTWNTLTELAKIGMIAGMTGVFAGSSWYTKNRMGLKNTGEALYVLAQMFVGIMLVALWGYHFLWEDATLELVIFLYLCWLAVWGVFHANILLQIIFLAISCGMMLYRWAYNNEVQYPVAAVDTLYMLLCYVYTSRSRISNRWMMAYAGFILLTLLGMTGKNAAYSFWVAVAAGCVNYARRYKGCGRHLLFTIAVLAGCAAFYVQNFISIHPVIQVEYNLLPVVVFIWSLGPIWQSEDIGDEVKMIQFLMASACLYSLGMTIFKLQDSELTAKLFHTVVMACACLSIILLTTHYRSTTGKRSYIKWQILGTVSLIWLVLRVTWSFWASLGWWVYLLAAGAVLIAVAAVKEIRDREQEE